jgi:hypothetical protein
MGLLEKTAGFGNAFLSNKLSEKKIFESLNL